MTDSASPGCQKKRSYQEKTETNAACCFRICRYSLAAADWQKPAVVFFFKQLITNQLPVIWRRWQSECHTSILRWQKYAIAVSFSKVMKTMARTSVLFFYSYAKMPNVWLWVSLFELDFPQWGTDVKFNFYFWCHRAQNQTLENVVGQTNQTNKADFYLAIWFPGAARGASLSAPNKLKAKPHIPAGLV